MPEDWIVTATNFCWSLKPGCHLCKCVHDSVPKLGATKNVGIDHIQIWKLPIGFARA
jgi:hypothetical protein